MRKILIVCLLGLLVFCQPSYAIEFLIKAKPHWKDSWTQEQVDALSPEAKKEYDSRSQVGDIIVVRPDGWEWGNEECLPNFIIVKVPDMTMEEAKQYEESLIDAETMEVKKVRKYHVEEAEVNDAKNNGGVLQRTKAQKKNNKKIKISSKTTTATTEVANDNE